MNVYIVFENHLLDSKKQHKICFETKYSKSIILKILFKKLLLKYFQNK